MRWPFPGSSRPMGRPRPLAFLCALLASAAVQAQQTSQLLPLADGRYAIQTVSFAGRDCRLDDFSYADYYLGARDLGDIAAAVQEAISAAGATGGLCPGR